MDEDNGLYEGNEGYNYNVYWIHLSPFQIYKGQNGKIGWDIQVVCFTTHTTIKMLQNVDNNI